jgi:signal peptidase II
MFKWLWLSVIVFGLDQGSKYLADTLLQYHVPVPVVPFFNLTLSYNTGAAFSFLSDAGGWQRWFFVVLAATICVVLIAWLRGLDSKQRWVAVSISLIIGGAIGNVVDRVIFGHVIDFIDVYYQDWHWPIFNIADSAITVGVAIMLIDGLFGKSEKQHTEGM